MTPPPIQVYHRADEGGEGVTLPPHTSDGKSHTRGVHPLTRGRLNYGGGADFIGGQSPMPEPLGRTIKNAGRAYPPVALGGNAVLRPRCRQLGEGGCTHAGGVSGRVLEQGMFLADRRANPQGGWQGLLRNRVGGGPV